jgi:hypothetical protein
MDVPALIIFFGSNLKIEFNLCRQCLLSSCLICSRSLSDFAAPRRTKGHGQRVPEETLFREKNT